MESTKIALDCFLGVSSDYEFVLHKFSSIQKEGGHGDWYSDHFSVDGHNLQLNVETKEKGPMMKVRLCHTSAGSISSSMRIVATIQLLNHLSDHSHYSKYLNQYTNKKSSFSCQ